MKFQKYTLLFVSLGLLATTFSYDVNAKQVQSYKELEEIQFMPEATFNDKTKLVENVPYDDPFLDYQIRLPKDFESVTSKLTAINFAENVSQQVLGVMSRYSSPPVNGVRSSFVLEALELTFEISARNWFINYIIVNGLSLDQVSIENETNVEAIYTEIIKDVTYNVRIKAVKNGPRIVMARYYMPQQLFEGNKVIQAQVIDSFKLNNTEKVDIEELKGYAFLDQTYMKYPASWKLEGPYIRSIDRMMARVYRKTKGDRLDGQINIYISKKDDEKKRSSEVAYYKEKMILNGYRLGEFLEKLDFEYQEEMKIGFTEAYTLNALNRQFLDYEIWFSFLENKEYYYFISLYTPERDINFASWARNVEAYKILLENLRRNNIDPNYMKIDQ